MIYALNEVIIKATKYMLLLWIIIFIVSLFILLKGADWFLSGSEKIGFAMGLSPFIIGVVIVGLGTSLPEIASSLAAVIKGVTQIVPANAIGSNIANILLVVGISAVWGGRLAVTKNLIDLDLPLLAISTALFLDIAWDKQITFGESVLLLVLFVIYLAYTIFYKDEKEREEKNNAKQRPKISSKDIFLLLIGGFALIAGAKYLVDSVVKLSEILAIGTGAISLAAVAFGTSLPELFVSVKAARQNKPEIALGNIFGSNVFNILVAVGLPGLFGVLKLDGPTFKIGLPMMLIATVLFIISGISRRIHVYEGAMYLVIYAFFIGKIFNLI